MEKYDCLKLENQLCFPLYVCSKEIIRKYKPLLDKIDLTYTQYITMMVLWSKKSLTVTELGKYLYLDSGTLTPLLKKLENKGYIRRVRSSDDERNLIIEITSEGLELRKEAVNIPEKVKECISLSDEEAMLLYKILYKIIDDNKFKEE